MNNDLFSLEEINTKVILNPAIARKLLQMGNSIIDIKPNKKDGKQTVFIFCFTSKFKKDLESLS